MTLQQDFADSRLTHDSRTHDSNILKVCYCIAKTKQCTFQLDLKSGSDSVSFSEFLRKLFQMEGPLNEIVSLLLLTAVVGILQINCKKFVGYPRQIFSKLTENVKGAVLLLIWYIKTATLKMFNL